MVMVMVVMLMIQSFWNVLHNDVTCTITPYNMHREIGYIILLPDKGGQKSTRNFVPLDHCQNDFLLQLLRFLFSTPF